MTYEIGLTDKVTVKKQRIRFMILFCIVMLTSPVPKMRAVINVVTGTGGLAGFPAVIYDKYQHKRPTRKITYQVGL